MKLKNNIALLCLFSLLTQNMFGSDHSQALVAVGSGSSRLPLAAAAGAVVFSVASLVTAGVASSRAGRANKMADELTARVIDLENWSKGENSGDPATAEGHSAKGPINLQELQTAVVGCLAGLKENSDSLRELAATSAPASSATPSTPGSDLASRVTALEGEAGKLRTDVDFLSAAVGKVQEGVDANRLEIDKKETRAAVRVSKGAANIAQHQAQQAESELVKAQKRAAKAREKAAKKAAKAAIFGKK